jgi:poly-gamma-glutamate capsule biosynthesis protein CapA/YwtB (metallophosphatase superfamily)
MRRREFLQRFGMARMHLAGWGCVAPPRGEPDPPPMTQDSTSGTRAVTLFLCGDVMIGRGIDQILGHPSKPRLYEDYVNSALDYVGIAESRNGPIPRGVKPSYPWGEALEELDRVQPDLRIINLETSITTSEDAERKGINYRMHPANVACLIAARIHCCVLANNHVLDWGRAGLADTLRVLRDAKIHTAGAGEELAQAQRPAVMDVRNGGRVLVYGIGGPDCGIPPAWGAGERRSGVAAVSDFSKRTVSSVVERIAAAKRPGDIAVVSIHWGSNWGYGVPKEHRAFAHQLLDGGVADVVHGHSSHHPKGIEVYQNKLILYSCGDFLNDYEGIGGYEQFRGDLVLMYFPTLAPATGELLRLTIQSFQIRRFQLRRATKRDQEWLRDTLNREGRELGAHFLLQPDGSFQLV